MEGIPKSNKKERWEISKNLHLNRLGFSIIPLIVLVVSTVLLIILESSGRIGKDIDYTGSIQVLAKVVDPTYYGINWN